MLGTIVQITFEPAALTVSAGHDALAGGTDVAEPSLGDGREASVVDGKQSGRAQRLSQVTLRRSAGRVHQLRHHLADAPRW